MINLAGHYGSAVWLTQIALAVSQIAFAEEAIEPSATLKAEVVGPRLVDMPLEFQLTITNTGKEPISYWCGGPGRYPSVRLYLVEITNEAGKTWTVPLTNGQYEEGSGSFQSIRETQTVPAVCDPLPEGSYTLKVSGKRSGYLKDGKKIITWPAMTAKPVTIEIKDDPALLKKIEKNMLITAESHPFAKHVAQRYGIDPVVKT